MTLYDPYNQSLPERQDFVIASVILLKVNLFSSFSLQPNKNLEK